MAQVLLHGVLHVTIYEVDNLSGGSCFLSLCKVIEILEDKVGFGKGTSNLYATIDLENSRVGSTRVLEKKTSNPQWYESFHIYCAHKASNIVFTVKQDNHIGAEVIGRAYIPAGELLTGKDVDQWLHLMDHRHKPLRDGSKIHVKLRFLDASSDINWSQGIGSPKFSGVPHTFFAQRNDCRVTLYQDAHVPAKFVPKIPLDGDKYYEPSRCWLDIFDSICNARHLIYITGWSVWTRTTLTRDSSRKKNGGDLTLGELLIEKAREGVRVLMLVWDDRTSVKLLKKDGVMATHDEDTKSYFENTGVHCVLCPRNPDNRQNIVEELEFSTMFTHHQKIVIADAEVVDGMTDKRRIVSFIGGIDLCDGRYDTPWHSIFRTLGTIHSHDFHQPNFHGASIVKGGPREPWHDIHCKLEGPIAWDVLCNFEQRWRKQGHEDLLLELRELGDAFVPPSSAMFSKDEIWNVQLFRSIDGGAAFGFPESPYDAAKAGLVSGKGHVIDKSIQNAYIAAIRRAKSFIYIENQYFLGSSFAWSANELKANEVEALHLIPKELSLKIVSKIEAEERFTVYIVIPMWPEGVPESGSVQAILNWQKMTMEMMYKDILQALQAKGLEANPKDYLTFFCLGNREMKRHEEYEPPEKPEHGSDYSRAQRSRRFMIYVHAKMMIVDDEYIIIGSANINQRSMDGARDTEIAMGAYQPHHLSIMEPAHGQIHGHRLALWYEHMGILDDIFHTPERLECVRRVNQIAENNWDLYSCETLDDDLPCHLLSYPIRVTENGDVTTLPNTEYFPDTKARVLGSKSEILPSILTT